MGVGAGVGCSPAHRYLGHIRALTGPGEVPRTHKGLTKGRGRYLGHTRALTGPGKVPRPHKGLTRARGDT